MLTEPIIVLGAGFQGVCVALGAQRQGYAVTLIDKAPDCMLRASLRNEGKIHLGFVYANDASCRTSSLMLRSSLAFARLVEEWSETRIDWNAFTSRPFLYVIARNSLLSPENLLARYEQLQKTYREMRATEGSRYLGNQLPALWREIPPRTLQAWVNEKFAVKGVETVEVALHLPPFRGMFRRDAVVSSGLYIRSTYESATAADAYWIFGLALKGRFCFVPSCSCQKRYYSTSTHARMRVRIPHVLDGFFVLRSYLRDLASCRSEAFYGSLIIFFYTLLRIVEVVAQKLPIPKAVKKSMRKLMSRILRPFVM